MAVISATFEDIFEDVIDYYRTMNLYITSAQNRVRYYGNFPGLDHPLTVNISASPTQTSGTYSALDIISRGLIKGITDFLTSGTEVSAFGFTVTENGISAIGSKIGINYDSLNLEITSAGQLKVVSIPSFQNINLSGSNLTNGQIIILSAGRLVTSAIHFGSDGVNVHSELLNLDSDDHGQYLHLFPISDSRNVIQLSADVIPLKIIEYSSQTKNVIQVSDSSFSDIFVVSANGDVAIQGHLIVSGSGKNLIFSDSNPHQITTPGNLTVNSSNQTFQTTSAGITFRPGLVTTLRIEQLSVSAVNQLIVDQNVIRINYLSGSGDRYVVADSFGNLRATSAIGGSVSGSAAGTVNRIAKFITSASVGDSLLLESAGLVSIDGSLKVGTGLSNSVITLNGANQQTRSLTYSTSGVQTWDLRTNSDNNISANNGSNLELNAYDVSGGFLDNPIFIYRSLGAGMLLKRPVIMTGSESVSGNIYSRSNQYFYGPENNIQFVDGGNYVISGSGYFTLRTANDLNIQADSGNIFFKPGSVNVLTLVSNAISAFNQYEFTNSNFRINYLSGTTNRNVYVDSFGNFRTGTSTSAIANVSAGATNYYALFSNQNTITSGSLYESSWGNVQLIASQPSANTSLEITNLGTGTSNSFLNIKTYGNGSSQSTIYLTTNVGNDVVWSIGQIASTSGFYIAYGSSLTNPSLFIASSGLVKLFNGLTTYGNLSATGSINFVSLSGSSTRSLGVDSLGNLVVVGSVSANISGTPNTHAKFVTSISVGDSLISESGTSILNAGNVYSTLTGGGFWIDSLGIFNYGMFKSNSNLAFRSGTSAIPRLLISSAGESIFSGSVSTSANLFVSGTSTFRNNISIGDIPNSSRAISIGMSNLTGIGQYGIVSSPVFNSQATNIGVGVYTEPTIANSSFTMGSLVGVYVADVVKGASASITNQYGLYIVSQTQGVTNYAIYTNTGLVRFGDAVTMNSTLSVAGNVFANSNMNVSGSLMITNNNGLRTFITNPRDMIARSGTTLQVGDGDDWTAMIFKVNSGQFTWSIGSTPITYLTLNTTGIILNGALNVSGATNLKSTFQLTNYSGSTTRILGIDSNGFVTPLLSNVSYISGSSSGTNNIVTKFSGANSLSNSTISDFGSNTSVIVANNLNVSGYTSLSGCVGIGGSHNTSYGLLLSTGNLTSSQQYGIASTPNFTSAGSTIATAFYSRPFLPNLNVTFGNVFGYYVDNPSKPTSATITTSYGLYVASQTAGQTNYAIYTGSGQVVFNDLFFANSRVNVSGDFSVRSNSILSGRVGIGGGNVASDVGLYVSDLFTGWSGTSNYGIMSDVTFSSSSSANMGAIRSRVRVPNSSFTVTNVYGTIIESAIKGTSATITNQYGLYVASQNQGTNNYAIYTNTGLVSFSDIVFANSRLNVSGLSSFNSNVSINGTLTVTSSASFQSGLVRTSPNLITGSATGRGLLRIGTDTGETAPAGSSSGRQLQLDDDEIQAMAGSVASPLYINYNGSIIMNGAGSTSYYVVIGRDVNSAIGRLDVVHSDGDGVIAAFGDSTNSTRPGYIYIAATNTINAGYGVDSDGSELWINYRGYANSNTRYRNFVIGDGRTTRWVNFDGANKRIIVNNGLTSDGVGQLQVNGKIGSNGNSFYTNPSYSTALFHAEATATTYFQANDGSTVNVRLAPGYNYLRKGTIIGSEDTSSFPSYLDVRTPGTTDVIASFGAESSLNPAYPSYIYFSYVSTINFAYNENSDAEGWINYVGYQNGITRYRRLVIGDGKKNELARFAGDSGHIWLSRTGGFVRIGDGTTPSYSLDVRGNDIRIGAANGEVRLRLETQSGSNTGYIGVESSTNRLTVGANAHILMAPNSGFAAEFKYFGTGDGRLRVGGTEADPTSTIHVNGSFATAYDVTSNSAGRTLGISDHTLIYTNSSTKSVTLPEASTCLGRIYVIKCGSNTSSITINRTSSDLFYWSNDALGGSFSSTSISLPVTINSNKILGVTIQAVSSARWEVVGVVF